MKRNIEVVKLALDFIDGNLCDELTFVSVSRRFHYSPYFFDRIFRRVVGKTITEYVRQQRLSACAGMLAGTRTITDICHECGFDSSQAFCRAFKRHFGVTPGAYRKAGTRPAVRPGNDIIREYLNQLKEGQKAMVPKIIRMDNDIILAGLSGDGGRTHETWERFEELEKNNPVADRISQDAFEVRVYPEDRCDIFVGIQVEHAASSGGYETYVLPRGPYASFEILLAKGWEHNNRLMDQWLVENGAYAQRRDDKTGAYYSIQVYGDRFMGMDNLDSVIGMWVPLVKVLSSSGDTVK